MKKFYDDPNLGIKSEDAPANSVSGGGVDLSVDKQIDNQKKKKKLQHLFHKRLIQHLKLNYQKE